VPGPREDDDRTRPGGAYDLSSERHTIVRQDLPLAVARLRPPHSRSSFMPRAFSPPGSFSGLAWLASKPLLSTPDHPLRTNDRRWLCWAEWAADFVVPPSRFSRARPLDHTLASRRARVFIAGETAAVGSHTVRTTAPRRPPTSSAAPFLFYRRVPRDVGAVCRPNRAGVVFVEGGWWGCVRPRPCGAEGKGYPAAAPVITGTAQRQHPAGHVRNSEMDTRPLRASPNQPLSYPHPPAVRPSAKRSGRVGPGARLTMRAPPSRPTKQYLERRPFSRGSSVMGHA